MNNRKSPEIIGDALEEVNFENLEELKSAAKDIMYNPEGIEIEGWKVTEWISEHLYDLFSEETDFFDCLKGIEEVFDAGFDPEFLIPLFFCAKYYWDNFSNEEILEEYHDLTGCIATADEVTKTIIDCGRFEELFGILGLDGIIEFLKDNGGDVDDFVKELIGMSDELSQEIIDAIILLTDSIEVESEDAEFLYEFVDWDYVKANDLREQYLEFFERFAPSLNID